MLADSITHRGLIVFTAVVLAAFHAVNARGDYSPWTGYYPGSGESGGGGIISLDLDPKSTLNSSFRVAARENRVKDMQRFLKDGADIDSRADEGTTALMYGARNCSTKVVDFLIHAKADPNVRDGKGRTALIYASMDSCPAVMKLLLKAPRVNAGLKDTSGKTAEDYALEDSVLEVGGPTSEIIKLLRAHHPKRAKL